MKNNTCKRTFSALLAVVMVVSMFGFTNMTASAWTGSAALESDGRPNASADAAELIFDISGRRINNERNAEGIVIKKSNGKTVKTRK